MENNYFLHVSFVHWLVILSAGVNAAGAYAYIRDTLLGKTKPNRVTWSMWALAPLVGTAAAVSAGADLWTTVRIFLAGFLPLLVFLSSFLNRQSYWKVSSFDLACGALSLLALLVWAAADSPRSAILLSALGDGFAAVPTLLKAWRRPDTETGSTFIASFLSVLLVLPSIPEWNIENSAFQLYLLIVNGLLIFALYRQRARVMWPRRH